MPCKKRVHKRKKRQSSIDKKFRSLQKESGIYFTTPSAKKRDIHYRLRL